MSVVKAQREDTLTFRQVRQANISRLEFSTTQLNLGDGKPNEILRGELKLMNLGAEPAKFSLVKHCACTELSPLDGELEPGASETIHVGLQLAAHANSEKNTSIEARTGDPAMVAASCFVSARCPAPYQVTPAFINFGSLAAEELANASAEISIQSIDGQPQFDAETLIIKHLDEVFQVSPPVVRTPPDLSQPRVTIRVTLNPGAPEGDRWDTLELRAANSDYSIRVPLQLTVVEPISVVPRVVALRKQPNGNSFAPVQLLVIARGGQRLTGAVSLADGPEGVEIYDLGDVSPGRRRLRMSITASTDNWPAESDVWLTTVGASHSLALKLKKPSVP